jgi:predicted Zn-dependent peptidase
MPQALILFSSIIRMAHRTYEKTLESGMKTVLIPLKNTDVVSVGIFIKTGSVNENQNTNGIAHFLEHMMFKGTKNRPGNKIAEQLDGVGAQYNAGTSKEYTYYYINGNNVDVYTFIDVIIDLYCNPLFRQEDINKEKHVVLEELDMGLDDPGNMLVTLIHEKLFDHSALGMPIIGTKQNILKFTRNQFLEFRHKYYYPEKSVFVISGNFKKNKVYARIKNQFKKSKYKFYKNDEFVSPVTISCIAHQKSPYIYLKNKPELNQTQIMFVFRSVSMFHNDSTSMDILSDVLSSGSSSRLFNLLRNKLGVTYFSHAYHMGYSKEGLFIIYLGVNNSRVFEVIKVVLKELHLLKTKGLTKKDFDKAKKIRKTSFKLSLQNPKDYLYFYGINTLFDEERSKENSKGIKQDPIKKLNDELDTIKLEDMNKIIEKTFSINNFNLFVYGNADQVKNKLKQLESLVNGELK